MNSDDLLYSALVIVAVLSHQDPLIAQNSRLDEFYRSDRVQTIRLQVAAADRQRMLNALPKRIYVPATFQWRDVTVDNVAVRFKGNSSSQPNQKHKRSFLIKFDRFNADGRFFGLRRVSFDNGIQFGSLFSEPVITGILRDQGLPTHRCNYARLYLNDRYQGVYVNVERIDESFLDQHWPESKGALFKVDEGGPGSNLQFLGEDPSAYSRAFEPKNETAEKEAARLVDLIRMIHQSPQPDFRKQLAARLEIDDFLRVTAVMLFSGAFDQLTGWNPHNYYLHHDRKSGRWRYLPWDLDVGFSETAFGKIQVLEDWHAAWPVPRDGSPNPLLERVLADPELLQSYRRTARMMLERYFEPERLCGIIDAKYALIRQDLRNDPFPHRRVTNPDDRDYGDVVESMKSFVRKRYTRAVQQLENPGQRPRPAPRRPQGPEPAPGPASKDAPTRLQAMGVSATSVTLHWKDNAENEAGSILQRAAGEQGGEFQNLIGQPGDGMIRATDRNIQPGKTYRYRVYAVHPTPDGLKGTGVSNVVTVHIPDQDGNDCCAAALDDLIE